MQPHQGEEPLEALIITDEGVSRWRKVTAVFVTLFIGSAFLLTTISTAPQLPQQISRTVYAICAASSLLEASIGSKGFVHLTNFATQYLVCGYFLDTR